MEPSKTIATAYAENKGEIYSTRIKVDEHILIADEPVESGGAGLGPAPGDFLCMSLASCQVITLRMYANRKKWDAGEISVSATLSKSDSGLHTFHCEIKLGGNLTPEQRSRMFEISKACPIHRLLEKPTAMTTTMLP